MKFGRRYSLFAQGVVNDYTIPFPLTMEFEITRNTLASINTARLILYNLAPDTRRDLYHDQYDTLTYKQVRLHAGYASEPSLPLIFQGNIRKAFSYRRGPDWVTELDCWDGGFGSINGQVSASIPSGWSIKTLISTLMGALPNVSQGAIGSIDIGGSRGVVLSGNAWDIMQQYTQNGQAFIDNEVVNVLDFNDYIINADGIPVITSATGLLNTPRRQDAILEVDMLFEPRAQVSQLIQIQSLESIYNGQYIVKGIRHRGTISGAICGEAITTLSLWLGSEALNAITRSTSAPAQLAGV